MKRLNITSYQVMKIRIRKWLSPNTFQTGYYQKKKQQIKSVGQDVERKEPTCTLGGNVNCTAMKKNSTEFLQKIKDRTNIRSNISTPGIYSKKLRTLIRKDTYTIMFTVALFIIAKRYGSNQNAQEWIKKRWYTNIYIYLHPYTQTCIYTYVHIHTADYRSAIKK